MEHSKEQKVALVLMALGSLLSGSVLSLQSPFFPNEAEKKGVPPSLYGLVFGLYEIIILIGAPIYGILVPKLGLRFCFCIGLFTTSYCCFLFGFLSMVPGATTFIVLAYIIRILEAAGQCAYNIASLSLIPLMFPDSINDKVAVWSASFSAGMICGPALGSVLYSLGGFIMPFFTLGLVLFVGVIFSMCIMPDLKSEKKDKQSSVMKVMLKCSHTWMVLFCCVAISSTFGFLLSTLEPHVRHFGFSSIVKGAFFLIIPVLDILSCRIYGKLVDKGMSAVALILMGCTLNVIGFIILGPLPGIPLSPRPYLVAAGLILCGIGGSAIYTLTFGELLRVAVSLSLPSDEETNSSVSGLFQVTASIGFVLGPTLGGIFLQYGGFRLASLYPFCTLIMALLFSIPVFAKCRIQN